MNKRTALLILFRASEHVLPRTFDEPVDGAYDAYNLIHRLIDELEADCIREERKLDQISDRLAYKYLEEETPEVEHLRNATAYAVLQSWVLGRFYRLVSEGWRFIPANRDPGIPEKIDIETPMVVSDINHDHPHWSPTTNFMFRCVHDASHHYPGNERYDLAGQIEAWKRAARDFAYWLGVSDSISRRALRLLFAEIVGQVVVPESRGFFAPQKDVLL